MAIPALQSHVPKRVPRLREAPWLNLLVTLALGMLVVHATAQLLSSVGEASELRQSVPPARISGRLTAEASGVTPETLFQLHLFGRVSEAGSERKQRITAPETQQFPPTYLLQVRSVA